MQPVTRKCIAVGARRRRWWRPRAPRAARSRSGRRRARRGPRGIGAAGRAWTTAGASGHRRARTMKLGAAPRQRAGVAGGEQGSPAGEQRRRAAGEQDIRRAGDAGGDKAPRAGAVRGGGAGDLGSPVAANDCAAGLGARRSRPARRRRPASPVWCMNRGPAAPPASARPSAWTLPSPQVAAPSERRNSSWRWARAAPATARRRATRGARPRRARRPDRLAPSSASVPANESSASTFAGVFST